jgi:hypothetical protein
VARQVSSLEWSSRRVTSLTSLASPRPATTSSRGERDSGLGTGWFSVGGRIGNHLIAPACGSISLAGTRKP